MLSDLWRWDLPLNLMSYWGANISGASMNSARSFGPALIVWSWVAPVLGGLIASGVYCM